MSCQMLYWYCQKLLIALVRSTKKLCTMKNFLTIDIKHLKSLHADKINDWQIEQLFTFYYLKNDKHRQLLCSHFDSEPKVTWGKSKKKAEVKVRCAGLVTATFVKGIVQKSYWFWTQMIVVSFLMLSASPLSGGTGLNPDMVWLERWTVESDDCWRWTVWSNDRRVSYLLCGL